MFDGDYFIAPINKNIEGNLEIMKSYSCDLMLKHTYLWCMECMMEGHPKDNC